MTLIEDFLLADINDNDLLARTMDIELRLAEKSTNWLNINSVRCAAHTLELDVKDTIDTNPTRKLPEPCQIYIKTVRKAIDVVRNLRTTKMKLEIEFDELLSPVPFISVQWSSVNTMVISFTTAFGFNNNLIDEFLKDTCSFLTSFND